MRLVSITCALLLSVAFTASCGTDGGSGDPDSGSSSGSSSGGEDSGVQSDVALDAGGT